MQISVEELTKNPDMYLDMLRTGDIYIARNGENIARLSGITPKRKGLASSLFGILPPDASLEEAREERLRKI